MIKDHEKLIRLSLLSTLVLISYIFTFWNIERYSKPSFAEINTPSSNIQRDILGGNDDEEIVDSKILDNGKILSLGYGSNASYYRNIVIYRYNSNGTLDTSFNGGLGYTTVVENKQVDPERMAIQTDGKIVVTGDKYVDDTNKFDMILWRFNSDGSLDTSFNGTGIVTHNNAAGGNDYDNGMDVKITSTGKIIVVGYSRSVTSNDRDLVLWKYNTDGTLDTSFDTDGISVISSRNCSGCGDFGRKLDIDPNNKIIVAGKTVIPDEANGLSVYRFNENGSLDTSFNTTGSKVYSFDGTGSEDDFVTKIQALSSGKYLITGYGQRNNPPYINTGLIFRINSDSNLDTTFNETGYKVFDNAPASQKFYNSSIDPFGKFVLVGEKIENGNTDILVTRLNSDGTVDTSFGTDGSTTYDNLGGGNGYEKAGSIESKDNKYYIGGVSDGSTTYTDPFLLVLTNTFQVKNLTGGMKAFVGENEVTLGTGYGTYGSQTLRIEDSSGKYITNLNATFNSDLDFSSFVASTDSTSYKSYIGSLTGITGVNSTYDLYVPKKDGDNVVGLCPNQISIDNINSSCSGYTRTVNTTTEEIGGNNYWKLSALSSPYGAFSQNFKVNKVKIESIGLINKIPDNDTLKYYFLSSTLDIKGSADPSVNIKFKLGDNYYTSQTDTSGKFSIEIKSVPLGTNTFSYYAITSDNIESERRTLTMVLGCDNFTPALKEIYCPDTVESESSTSTSSLSTLSSTSSDAKDTITIRIRDNTDSPVLGVDVYVGDRKYKTDNEGNIQVDKNFNETQTIIKVGDQTFIQNLNSEEEIKIIVAIDPEFYKQSSVSSVNTGVNESNFVNVNTLPIIIGCLVLTLVIVIFVFIIRKRRTRKLEEEFKTSP